MAHPVRHGRVAVASGLAVAALAIFALLAQPVPDRIVGLLGGPTGLERVGGIRIVYRDAGATEARRIELARAGVAELADLRDVLVHGGLALHVIVPGQDVYPRELLTAAAAAKYTGEHDRTGVTVDEDVWRPEDGRALHRDVYLRAPTREAIERTLADAAAAGWQPPPDVWIGFEHAHAWTEQGEPYWRTYVLSKRSEIDGSMIASAVKSYDPNTNRPIVLLDFTREGARRFCELTRAIAGEKLATVLGGRVRSAPIINGQICGGRASITMGGASGRAQELEADATVAALSSGAMPRGGEILEEHDVKARDAMIQEWLGRLVIGGAAGTLVAVLVLFVLAYVRPSWQPRAPTPAGEFPWGRLGITLLAPLTLVIGSELSIPGLNELEFEYLITKGDLKGQFSVIALGWIPLITGFVVVEMVALAIPRLRWRRHDPSGRRALRIAATALGIAVALVQGWFMASYLESLQRGGAELLAVSGVKFRLLVVCSLGAGTAVLAFVANVISARGLGNGYGVLAASALVLEVGQRLVVDPRPLDTADVAVRIAGMALIASATAVTLRWQILATGRQPGLGVPSSGFHPLHFGDSVNAILALVGMFGFGIALDDVIFWIIDVQSDPWVVAGLVLSGLLAWSWLFARPSVVERAALQAGMERPRWPTWLRATAASALLVVIVHGTGEVVTWGDPDLSLAVMTVQAMFFAATMLDIVADANGLRSDRVAVWELHQIQHVGIVRHVLDGAGIPHHLHARNLRTLGAFFTPYAPVLVYVDAAHAETAGAKLADALRPPRGKLPVSRLADPRTTVA